MNLLRKTILLMVVSLTVVAGPSPGAEKSNELIFKICFPVDSGKPQLVKECTDEDCGLEEEPMASTAPTIRKNQKFSFLGATDYGAIWGSGQYRVIGDDRIRFLLYVIPGSAAKESDFYATYTLIPDRVIQTVFFSSYNEYLGQAVSMSFRAVPETEEQKKTGIDTGALQMVDLHCSAKKMKLYDNHSIYFRAAEPQSKDNDGCVELVWEKPETPLQWQPVSSMTMNILSDFYCRSLKQ